MASTATYKCLSCGGTFTARTADRERGWARYCSKSCKAIKQEARTGQNRAYQQRQGYARCDSDYGLCFPSHAEGDVQ